MWRGCEVFGRLGLSRGSERAIGVLYLDMYDRVYEPTRLLCQLSHESRSRADPSALSSVRQLLIIGELLL